ncbi:MAG: ATP-binding protein [Candidatus Komeilibacteria bacterium]
MNSKRQTTIRHRLLFWIIITAVLPLLFLTLALIFYLAPVNGWQALLLLLRHTLLVPLLASVVLLLTLSFMIAWEITRPLAKLQSAVERAARGQTDVDIPTEGNDELAQLGRDFNKLFTQINKARRDLEAKVKTRTTELLRANEELQQSKTAMLNILEDVEEAKQRAEEQKQRIEIIIQRINDPVIVVDFAGRIILNNEPAAQAFGQAVLEGKEFDQLAEFYDQDKKPIQALVKSFLESQSEARVWPRLYRLLGGNKTFWEVSISKFLSGGAGAVISLHNITKAVEVDRMKSEFVSVASHQLRTPLSAVKWLLELLLAGDVGELNKQQLELLQDAFASNNRMIDLVNDLLNVSRLESAKIEVKPESVNLAKLLAAVQKDLAVQVKQKKLQWDDKAVDNVPDIKVDPSLISQVLQNLLSNAVKYSRVGTTITLLLRADDKNLYFQVSDQGVGIPPTQQDRIFEKFFRADNVTRLETEGTGLGLYISKLLVELSGGNIGFKSQEGKGTSFYFNLPRQGSVARSGVRTLSKINQSKLTYA